MSRRAWWSGVDLEAVAREVLAETQRDYPGAGADEHHVAVRVAQTGRRRGLPSMALTRACKAALDRLVASGVACRDRLGWCHLAPGAAQDGAR